MVERMAELFLRFFNVSISACWIVIAALIFRLIFKKAPKWINILLWGIVAIRLIMPFSIESKVSIVPSVETVSHAIMYSAEPKITSGIYVVNSTLNPIIMDSFAPATENSATPLQILIPVFAVIWVFVITAMIMYLIISLAVIKTRMGTAVKLSDNIYQSEKTKTPFVLGILHPAIYLPYGISEKDMALVIAHEKAHINRHDNLIKPFAFILLSLYWFNPAMWIAYILLCRDIEYACDERVIKKLDPESRANYSEALLNFCKPKKIITACPLAFSAVGVKERVKRVLSYKKPLLWIIIAAIVSCAVIAVVLLTDPVKEAKVKSPDEWPELADTAEGYTIEQAQEDGCFVIDGAKAVYGKSLLLDFIAKANRDIPAKMRVYSRYISSEYPQTTVNYSVEELEYVGGKYISRYTVKDEDTGTYDIIEREYSYLTSEYSEVKNAGTHHSVLLSNTPDVAFEEYINLLLRSYWPPEYDKYRNVQLFALYACDDNVD